MGEIILESVFICVTAWVSQKAWAGTGSTSRPRPSNRSICGCGSRRVDLPHNRLVVACADMLGHADIDAPVPYPQNKHVLFNQVEGRRNGRRSAFFLRGFEVDTSSPTRAVGQETSRACRCLRPPQPGQREPPVCVPCGRDPGNQVRSMAEQPAQLDGEIRCHTITGLANKTSQCCTRD